jgi:anti-sigma factor RsiW
MSCERIEPALTGYHFGVLSDEERGAVEAHLPGCRACVTAMVALKRAIETGEDGPRPSPALRARLRDGVARELGLVEPPHRRWERPVAFAFAASALLAALFATRSIAEADGTPPLGADRASEPPRDNGL